MSDRAPRFGLSRFSGEYRRAWDATGPAGRGFLIAGLFYLVRAIAFTVAFPLYAKERGFGNGEIGLFLAASQSSLLVLGVPFTLLGGRGHARRVMILAPVVAAVGIALIVSTTVGASTQMAFGALLAGAGGASFWVLGDPLLAQSTPIEERARIYALKFFLLTIGAALGGGLGGWIPGMLELGGASSRGALTATIALLGSIDLAQTVLYRRIPSYESGARELIRAGRGRQRNRRSGWMPWIVITAFAVPEIGMALGHNGVRPFLSLYFTQEHEFTASATGSMLAGLGLLGGIGALATPRIAARMGNFASICVLRIAGSIAIVLWFSGIGLAPILGMMVIYYLAMDGTEAMFISESMTRIPSSLRTWFSGIYAMAWSVSAATASILSGTIQDRQNGKFGIAFTVGAGGYVVSVLWIALVLPRLPRLSDDKVADGRITEDNAAAINSRSGSDRGDTSVLC